MLPNPGMVQNAFHPSQDPPNWTHSSFGWETDAGVDVTPENALMVMAFLACVRIISDTIASLPLITYRRLVRGKERAIDHYLYPVLHDEANPEMSAFTFRRLLLAHECTRGNGLAEIEFDNAGRVRALWPLNPDNVTWMGREPVTGNLFYIYRLPMSVGGYEVKIPAERIFHIKWLTNNGLWAMSPVGLARNAVALSIATEKNGATLFGNGSEPGIMLKTPNKLTDKAYNRVKSDWEERHKGLDKKHRLAILEEGLDIAKLAVDPDDAQFLQTRVHQVSEFGRLFGISDDMLNQQGASATYASVEQFGLRFSTYTIRPWTIGFEQESNRMLLTPLERKTIFSEHLVDGLLRGDSVARMTSQSQGFMVGKYSINDMLEMDNQNPLTGVLAELGDMHFVPLNMTPLDQVVSADNNNNTPRSNLSKTLEARTGALPLLNDEAGREIRAVRSVTSRKRLMIAECKVIQDVAARVLRREIRDVLDAAKKAIGKRDAQSMDLWLSQYFHSHEELVRKQFLPVMSAYAEMVAGVASDEVNSEETAFRDEIDRFARAYAAGYASRHVGISQANISEMFSAALHQEDPLKHLEASLGAYPDARSAEIARWESNRENNAAARLVYVMAGMKNIRWNAKDKCAYCTALDQKVIGVDEYYLRAGQDYQPEGVDKAFSVKHDTGHPPLCNGCECLISAER